jgi:hypothetical protein
MAMQQSWRMANRRHEPSLEVPGWQTARRPLFRMTATICATDFIAIVRFGIVETLRHYAFAEKYQTIC